MKNWKLLVATYCCGAFLTNSYVREFRYDDWYKVNKAETHQNRQNYAINSCLVSTLFWPMYGTLLISDKIVHTLGHTNVKIEKPEIMKGRSPK